MSDKKPDTEIVEPEGKKPEEQDIVKPVIKTEDETPVEEWDKVRAAKTIQAQREEVKTYKVQLKELETLKAEKKQREDAELTESQKLTKQAEELKAENAQLQDRIIRSAVVAEVGLPADFAKRLQGATKEEMLADAKELLKALPQIKAAPKLKTTDIDNGQVVETDAQKRERIFGHQQNPFDLKTIQEKGGGVFWGTPSKENKE